MLALLAVLFTLADPPPAPVAVVRDVGHVTSGASFLLDATPSVSGRPLVWKQIEGPETITVVFDQKGRPNVALFAPKPGDGTYRFALLASTKLDAPPPDDLATDFAVIDVTVGAAPPPVPVPPLPTPNPPPTPPAPTPSPQVITGPLWVSYIVDASTETPAQAEVRTNAALRSGLKAAGVDYRTYEADQPEVAARGLAAVATAAGLPCAVIEGPDGKVLSVLKNPTAPDIAAAVGKLLGRP